jgi:glycerophosphoryl diester phosphodiesterase
LDGKITWIALFVVLTAIVIAPGGTIGINSQNKGKASGKVEVTNIAHRGARGVAPENTLIAARKAYESGADAWETDVQFTADQSIVLMHDDTLERTTNVESIYPDRESYAVKEFTLEEIRQLDAGSWFVDSDPFDTIANGEVSETELRKLPGVKVPTLREALELTKRLNWKVNLEVKPLEGDAELLVKKVVDLIVQMEMEDQVIISSFDHSIVRFARELNPQISRGVLVEEARPGVVDLVRKNGASYYNISASVLRERQALRNLEELKAAEEAYGVNVYTVNERDDLEFIVKNPLIDGIFTDFPGRLDSIISSMNR